MGGIHSSILLGKRKTRPSANGKVQVPGKNGRSILREDVKDIVFTSPAPTPACVSKLIMAILALSCDQFRNGVFEVLKIAAKDTAGPKSVLDLLLHKTFILNLLETGKKYSHPLPQKQKEEKQH